MEFVTFEIAKKLEEKVFDWDTSEMFERNILACRYDDCRKPTISQVLKWLREEKQYHICIGYNGEYSYEIVRIQDCEFEDAEDGYDTYEQAALAGIEYALNNLI